MDMDIGKGIDRERNAPSRTLPLELLKSPSQSSASSGEILAFRNAHKFLPNRMCFSDSSRSCFLTYMCSFNISNSWAPDLAYRNADLAPETLSLAPQFAKTYWLSCKQISSSPAEILAITMEEVIVENCHHNASYFFLVCGRRAACVWDSLEKFLGISRLLYLH